MVLGREGPSVQIGATSARWWRISSGCQGAWPCPAGCRCGGWSRCGLQCPAGGDTVCHGRDATAISLLLPRHQGGRDFGRHGDPDAAEHERAIPVIMLPHYDAPALKALWLFLFMGAVWRAGVRLQQAGARLSGWLPGIASEQAPPLRHHRHGVAGTFGMLSLFAPSVTGGVSSSSRIWWGETMRWRRSSSSSRCDWWVPSSAFARGPWWCLCADPGTGHPVRGDLWSPVPLCISRSRHRTGRLCHRRHGGAFRRHRACPITGIVLVTEMTDNYQLILPMMITTIGATLGGAMVGGVPSIPRSWSELFTACCASKPG